MSDTADFFEELSRRGHEPLLQRVQATIRFEITDSEPGSGSDPQSGGDEPTGEGDDGSGTTVRLVTVDHGDLGISTDGASSVPADATIGCSASELDALVNGRTSAMASLLRGALTVRGDPELIVLAQRLFSRHPAPATGSGVHVGEGRPS